MLSKLDVLKALRCTPVCLFIILQTLFLPQAYAAQQYQSEADATTRVGNPPIASNLLPNPLPKQSASEISKAKGTVSTFAGLQDKVAVYKKVEALTGLPWQVIAGINKRESLGGSVISGTPIGQVEPDLAGQCKSTDKPGNGTPVPVGGGCGFLPANSLSGLEDSARWAVKILKDKLGGHLPGSYEELAKALSRYNGTGNTNCGRVSAYSYCPPSFEGDDSPYALNFFDDPKHAVMYQVYCDRGIKCNPIRQDPNTGALTDARALWEYGTNL